MKLTPLAKLFITLVVLGVVGYTGYHYYGDQLKELVAEGGRRRRRPEARPRPSPPAPPRKTSPGLKNARSRSQRGVSGLTAANLGPGKLGRPLVVGINTWAGHAPGIVANGGLEASASSLYKKRYGLEVKFVLLEDPRPSSPPSSRATSTSCGTPSTRWAREASALAEQEVRPRPSSSRTGRAAATASCR